MGIFTRFLTRELGKNTGKWVSNTIFGDSWSTPHRVSVNEKNRAERLKAQREKDAAKLQLQRKKVRANEIKLLTSQLERFRTLVKEGYMTRGEFETAKRNILSKLARL